MRTSLPRVSSTAALLALAACHGSLSSLRDASSAVSASPASLSFGSIFVGASAIRNVTLANGGAGADHASLALSGAGFSVTGPTSIPLAGGAIVQVAVTFAPTAAGPASGQLAIHWSNGSATVSLDAAALADLACPDAGACETATFDPQRGSCVTRPVADGTACTSSDPCLLNGACVSGQCLGELASCDDGDACTTDYCVEGIGCQHQPVSCGGSDPCQVEACDPARGCVASAAPDGTPCAAEGDCQSAGACVSGACHTVGGAALNGLPCKLWWAPCVTDATCENGSCDSPTADSWRPGQPLWHWDGGDLPSFAVDDGGTSYPVFWEDDDGGGSWRVGALDSCGRLGWTSPVPDVGPSMLAGGQVVVAGMTGAAGFEAATGQPLWSQLFWQLPDAGTFQANALALSGGGDLAMVGFEVEGSGQSLLTSLTGGGSEAWVRATPVTPLAPNVMLEDSAGNGYLGSAWICPETSCTAATPFYSIDPQGALRFSLGGSPANALTPLAVGRDYLLTLAYPFNRSGAVALSAFALDGGWLYDSPVPLQEWLWEASTTGGAVIDAAGTAYVAGLAPDDFIPWTAPDAGWELEALDRSGKLRWRVDRPAPEQAPVSTPALGDGQTLFVVAWAQDHGVLEAYDTGSGALSWQSPLGDVTGAPVGASWPPMQSIALTPAAEILVSDPTGVTAYFAGRHRPPAGAPWPRGGGDNSNRNAAAP